MTAKKVFVSIYIVLSLIAIILLSVLYIKEKQKKKESLCLCSGLGTQKFKDINKSQQMYQSGYLTENSDLAKMYGGPRWGLSTYMQ